MASARQGNASWVQFLAAAHPPNNLKTRDDTTRPASTYPLNLQSAGITEIPETSYHTTMATRAPPPGLPAKVAAVPPNQTLYVSNLPSAKIQKEDLRTALYMLFSTYGSVLDVVALKTMKMRGQAHIVYKDIQTATQAMRSLDGFEFFGRPMVSFYPAQCDVADLLTVTGRK
jgi:hypothetical protein